MRTQDGLVSGLRQQIVDQLRDDVLCGRLTEGQRLSEKAMVTRFKVSRTPIREAMLQLAHEGLLESRPNCGVRVALHAPDSICQLVRPIRRTLEAFALRMGFDQIGKEHFWRWDMILARLRAACVKRDVTAAAEQDVALHRSIVRVAEQSDLEAIWLILVARIRADMIARIRTRLDPAESNGSNPLDLFHEHKNLINVFRTGDEEIAVKALESQLP